MWVCVHVTITVFKSTRLLRYYSHVSSLILNAVAALFAHRLTICLSTVSYFHLFVALRKDPGKIDIILINKTTLT